MSFFKKDKKPGSSMHDEEKSQEIFEHIYMILIVLIFMIIAVVLKNLGIVKTASLLLAGSAICFFQMLIGIFCELSPDDENTDDKDEDDNYMHAYIRKTFSFGISLGIAGVFAQFLSTLKWTLF